MLMNSTGEMKYMPGYTGHVPKVSREEVVNRIEYKKHIPGYRGYIQSVKPENKFGESYGKLTHKALTNQIEKGSDLPPYSRYTSTTRETFINQRNVKIQSTAELLGVGSRKDIYKRVSLFIMSSLFLLIQSTSSGVLILKY